MAGHQDLEKLQKIGMEGFDLLNRQVRMERPATENTGKWRGGGHGGQKATMDANQAAKRWGGVLVQDWGRQPRG